MREDSSFVRESPCSVEHNILDCNIVVNKFELQLCNYIRFRTNSFRKGMNSLIPQAMG